MANQQLFFKIKSPPKMTGTVTVKSSGLIHFSQKQISDQVQSGKLKDIKIRFNGLCEIICNYVLLEDMLGQGHTLPQNNEDSAKNIVHDDLIIELKNDYTKSYRDQINVKNLETVQHTHILNVTNFVSRLLAFLFSVYPCNIFPNGPLAKPPYNISKSVNGKMNITVDQDMLAEKLDELKVGTYIKFFAFEKTMFSMEGHSMLIKKMGHNHYSFFDPNHGEYTNLKINQLAETLNDAVREYHANQMVFLDAKAFIKDYHIEKNIDVSAKDMVARTLTI